MDGIAARKIRGQIDDIDRGIGLAVSRTSWLMGAFRDTPAGPVATRLAALLSEAHELVSDLASADPEYVEAIKAADREQLEAIEATA